MLPRRHKGFTKNDICTSNWLLTARKVWGNIFNWKSYGFLHETAVKTTHFACKSIGKSMKNQWNLDFSSKITKFKNCIFLERFFYILKKNSRDFFWYHVDAENAQLSIAGIFSRIRYFWTKIQSSRKKKFRFLRRLGSLTLIWRWLLKFISEGGSMNSNTLRTSESAPNDLKFWILAGLVWY